MAKQGQGVALALAFSIGQSLGPRMIPAAPDADSSGIRGGRYRAPGWRVAARETKTHTNGHSL